MKMFLRAAALVLALSPIQAFANEEIDVKITGMTCGSCSAKVEKALKALKIIDKDGVKVELAGNHAIVKVKKNDKATQDAIKAAVKKAGYEVATIEVMKPTMMETPATKTN
jgi:Cu+-exporting ATPase